MPDNYQINTGLEPAWASPQTFGSVLLTMFLDTYGTEALDWDPATIQIEIEQDFGLEIPPGNYERLMTAIQLVTTNSFYTSTPDFLRACVVLSGHHPTPELMLLPDTADLAWGITEGVLIMPPEDEDQNPFSEEIIGYISQAIKDEGILNPPDILQLATKDQSLLARINYDWSDDPEMFSAIQKMEGDKTKQINDYIKSQLRALLIQLAALPLRVGKTEELVKRMSARLPSSDTPLP